VRFELLFQETQKLADVPAANASPFGPVELFLADVDAESLAVLLDDRLVVAEFVFITLREILGISQEGYAVVMTLDDVFREVIGHRLPDFRIGEFDRSPLPPCSPSIDGRPFRMGHAQFVFHGIGKVGIAGIGLRAAVEQAVRQPDFHAAFMGFFHSDAVRADFTVLQVAPPIPKLGEQPVFRTDDELLAPDFILAAAPPDAVHLPLLAQRLKTGGNRVLRIERRKLEQILGVADREIDRTRIAVGGFGRRAPRAGGKDEDPRHRDA